MPESGFDILRDHLLESGVAPRHVSRIVSELYDHQADLEREAIEHGLSADLAAVRARQLLGTDATIAAHVLSRPELKSWMHRYPHVARLILPVAYVAILPLAPIHASVANAPAIVRWVACLMLSALVTAALLLAMQMSIALS